MPMAPSRPSAVRLDSGTRVRIQSEQAGIARTHFTGSRSATSIPTWASFGRKLALIHLQDIQPWLADSPARLSPQIRCDVPIKSSRGLLDGATLRRSQLAGLLPD